MREIFYRIVGKKGDSEPHFVYEGLLIRSSDIKRLQGSSLTELNPDFATRVRVAAHYSAELLSTIADNGDISIFDKNKVQDLTRKTSKPNFTLNDVLELLEPVYSALRNHQL
jgi:hypothetical protein